jgi:hypothetical protein
LEHVFRCPRNDCERLFIARYTQSHAGYSFFESVPLKVAPNKWSDTVKRVSPRYCDIYDEASSAEQQGLKLVCGPGYRKALEFLVKDYLCAAHPARAEDIKREPLAKCIRDFIENPKIVATATRAAWLGNDEVHYLRAWEDKDLKDLKNLIDLTVHWIEIEELTKGVVDDMPEPGKATASTN